MRLSYDVVDVFTDRPFAGNQLAVVRDAEALSSGQCQQLAREFGYSETSFVGAQAGAGEYDVRIFTPEQEIPFAGHPTLGTAWVLRDLGLVTTPEAVQHCGAGDIGVRFEGDLVELSAEPRDLAGPVPAPLVRDLLRVVGLTGSDVAGETWVAGCGLSFVHVPVTEEAVLRARPATGAVASLFARIAEAVGPVDDLLDAVNVYAVSGEAPTLRVHARVFVPGVGVPEDPATGSAAAGLGLALAASGLLPEGGSYDIGQGLEMGRPSRLLGTVEAAAGRATGVRVAGRVCAVARGEIEVPGDQPAG